MIKKSNNYFKEKYSYKWAGTLEPLRIKDILTKIGFFIAARQRFRILVRQIMTQKLVEVKMGENSSFTKRCWYLNFPKKSLHHYTL